MQVSCSAAEDSRQGKPALQVRAAGRDQAEAGAGRGSCLALLCWCVALWPLEGRGCSMWGIAGSHCSACRASRSKCTKGCSLQLTCCPLRPAEVVCLTVQYTSHLPCFPRAARAMSSKEAEPGSSWLSLPKRAPEYAVPTAITNTSPSATPHPNRAKSAGSVRTPYSDRSRWLSFSGAASSQRLG